jgi:hypothetical protein
VRYKGVITAQPRHAQPSVTSGQTPFTPAEWVSTDPDRPVLSVTTKAPGFLVVTDTWMPGWTACVDGQPTPILRGNLAQRVVPLSSPGRHRIVLQYVPPGFYLGCGISAASLIVWTLLAACFARGRHPGAAGGLAYARSLRPGAASRLRRKVRSAKRNFTLHYGLSISKRSMLRQ